MADYYERAERATAKQTGGRRTKGSGNGPIHKADVHVDKTPDTEERLIETKSSTRYKDGKGYYIVAEAKWFTTVAEQAHRVQQSPRIVLALGEPMQLYTFAMDPTAAFEPGTVAIQKTATLYAKDLADGIESLAVGGMIWTRQWGE